MDCDQVDARECRIWPCQYPDKVEVITDSATIGIPATRVEMCIGLGAHDDYWNRSASESPKLSTR